MKLRYYQEEAVQSIFDYIFSGKKGNPIVALLTGGGKSVIIAEFVRRAMMMQSTTRVMMLTHVKELIVQNAEKIRSIWPAAPVGIYSAGVGRKDTMMPITFGGVQSVAKAIEKKGNIFKHIDFLIVDECHLIGTSDETTYRKVIATLRDANPNLMVIGLTATPYRLKNGLLTNDECGIFTDFCYDKTKPDDFIEFIEAGYLSNVVPKKTSTNIDLSEVHIVGGDYNNRELEDAIGSGDVINACVNETIASSDGRKKWITFTAGVDNCERTVKAFCDAGVPTQCVHSKKTKSENDAIIADFKAGKFTNLVNANKLTTGFDAPDIDLICMMRPTQSAALWVQMVGRGLRVADGKKDCLVLDFAGNTERLGAINNPFIRNKYGRKGKKAESAPPIKICPVCGVYNAAGVKFCVSCASEFTFQNSRISFVASDRDLIENTQASYHTLAVDKVFYSRSEKKGKADSIKVTYICGLKSFDEYVFKDWIGPPGYRAKKWLEARIGDKAALSFNEVLHYLRLSDPPKTITVVTHSGKTDIFSVGFKDER